jgi:glucosamine-6-phosphate deaminase
MSTPVTVFDNPEKLGWTLAGEILERARAQRRRRRPFLLGCPGGRSLRTTYRALARQAADMNDDLSHLVIVMMDEYVWPRPGGEFVACPINEHYSCLGFAFAEIQAPLNAELPASHCLPDHQIWIPDPADPGAYEERIEAAGGVDIFLLASGTSDGHVAFNPPGTPLEAGTRVIALAETTRQDNLATFPGFKSLAEVPTHGVSVGPATIARLSREAVLVIHGEHKREAARRVQALAAYDPTWPATIIHECRRASLYLDKAAAGG